MPRDLFPREADRVAIREFLCDGTSLGIPETATVSPSAYEKALRLGGSRIAWFEPDGTLMGSLSDASHVRLYVPYMATVFNAVLEMLGLPSRVEIETGRMPARYTFEGEYVDTGKPFLIAGPMTMRAWRASQLQSQP